MNSLTIQDALPVAPNYPRAAKVVSQTCWELQSYSNECQLHPTESGKVVPALAKRETSLSKWIKQLFSPEGC